jgi:hypothetical protein
MSFQSCRGSGTEGKAMDYGYAQMSRIRTTDLIAEADRHRLAKARAAASDAQSKFPRRRSVRAVLLASVLALVIVVGLSSAALARPLEDDPFFERTGEAPIVEVEATTASDGIDATIVTASGLVLVLGLGTAMVIRAQRTRPKAP